ncbi:MAG: hypothetical protein ACI9GC_001486 [Phycisphaerales bacterium]|jgi:hypothetical protein
MNEKIKTLWSKSIFRFICYAIFSFLLFALFIAGALWIIGPMVLENLDIN